MGDAGSELVERSGGPLGIVIAGASVNDLTLLKDTIEAVVVERRADVRDSHHDLISFTDYAVARADDPNR